MPASASIADWVGWMDFTSLDGVRKCLAINNRTGAGADTRLEFFAGFVLFDREGGIP